jgi:transposase InsO family protein
MQDDTGRWRCPPAEEFASEKGLYYRIISSSEIKWIYQRNLRFFQGYIENSDAYIDNDRCTKILEYIKESPGCSIKELVSIPDMPVDTFYSMIVQGQISLDLNNVDLEDKSHIYLYRTPQGAIACTAERKEDTNLSVSIRPGERISWCKKSWRIISDNNINIEILDEITSDLRTIDRPELIGLVRQGEIRNIEGSKPSINLYMDEKIRNASDEDWTIAAERLQLLKPLIDKGKYPENSTVNPRTLRNWRAKYKEAEEICNFGLIGLLPETNKKGNRLPKLPELTITKMDEVISEKYDKPEQKSKIVVYGDLQKECEKLALPAPSRTTISKRINNRPKHDTAVKRVGDKGAYVHEEMYHETEHTIPRHGSRPFEIVHIDHTLQTLEINDSKTGENAGRAWETCMIDAYSRKKLAFYLTFEEPSYRSCMMVIRDCVRRHGRMPETIVVDNGKEFRSKYFQALCALYGCTIQYRPPAKPRFGSICEKLMETTQTELINNLTGNTKIMRNVRQVTKKFNPKNLAIYTLEDLLSPFARNGGMNVHR